MSSLQGENGTSKRKDWCEIQRMWQSAPLPVPVYNESNKVNKFKFLFFFPQVELSTYWYTHRHLIVCKMHIYICCTAEVKMILLLWSDIQGVLLINMLSLQWAPIQYIYWQKECLYQLFKHFIFLSRIITQVYWRQIGARLQELNFFCSCDDVASQRQNLQWHEWGHSLKTCNGITVQLQDLSST